MLIPVRTVICVGVTSTTLDCINWKLMWVCLIDILSISPLSEQKKVTMTVFSSNIQFSMIFSNKLLFYLFLLQTGRGGQNCSAIAFDNRDSRGGGNSIQYTVHVHVWNNIESENPCTSLEFHEMENRELKQMRTATPMLGSKKSISF